MRAHPAGPRHGDLVAESHGVSRDPHHLEPGVWAAGVSRGDDGVLWLHGRDVASLAREFGTPVFLLDQADFRQRARSFHRAFAARVETEQDADVYYAAKAFLSVGVARWIAEEGLGLDVASQGELAVALAAGFPVERILFHGNNKSQAEIARALDVRVGRLVLDSDTEIERVAAAAAQAGRRQPVLIRATVGVEAHTHEFIATAHEDQKFGFSLTSGAAMAAIRQVLAHPSLELVGVHSHIGSQIFDTSGFEIAAHRAVGLLADVRDAGGVELPELNLGGGFGIAYTAADDPADIQAVATGLRAIVDRECAARDFPVPRLAVEPGRAVVGPTTFTLYEVGTVKPVELDGGLVRHYVSVDGGMSDNIRTALYGADYSVVLASRVSAADPVLSRVVGKHCESGDVVVQEAWLPGDLVPGDLLAVAATGAYCRSMASSYNVIGRPPVVAVPGPGLGGEVRPAHLLLRRETEDDLLALDVGREGSGQIQG